MAAFLTWLNQWQTGIDWIDDDHREIAAILNRLVEVNGHPLTQDPEIAQCRVFIVLDALIERTRRHFQAEEAFLRTIRFPGYEGHRCEHAMQLAEFADLRRSLEQDGAMRLSPDTLEEFKRWFFNHVVVEDRDYVDYYVGEVVTSAAYRAFHADGRVPGGPYRDRTD
ncbi:hemerythrin family protein [uncultured Thiodictyon sp.]|uniref:bacteriohemerythrin n=1 Tax=uncultured Thiodictyon sp. TaxID=1846217 RepID=UPI0025F1BDBB|nr:hemerythrin family protein [uncultured Thiodictyon sp.]